eukprot:m.14950 g.14950  ORF g.14950 m.14950 type:complete len:82 (-) comp6462_c0_seq1:940-1185(-)
MCHMLGLREVIEGRRQRSSTASLSFSRAPSYLCKSDFLIFISSINLKMQVVLLQTFSCGMTLPYCFLDVFVVLCLFVEAIM